MFVSVLGIDPGLTRCGFSLVRQNSDRTLSFERAGIFTTSPQEQISARLAEMHRDLSSLISETQPDAIAIERVIFGANASTAMSVAQVSGLVHSIAASFSIPITEYSPTEVKSAVAGDGRADKLQIQEMVMRLLKLKKLPKPADAADAIAIAITHVVSLPLNNKKDSENAVYNGSNLHNAIADAILKQTKHIPLNERIQERERANRERVPRRRRPGIVR